MERREGALLGKVGTSPHDTSPEHTGAPFPFEQIYRAIIERERARPSLKTVYFIVSVQFVPGGEPTTLLPQSVK